MYGKIVSALFIFFFVGVQTGNAYVDLGCPCKNPESLKDLEEGLDRAFAEVKNLIIETTDEKLPYIGLEYLGSFIWSRHLDYVVFLRYYGSALPLSKKEIEYSKQMDKIASKYDDDILELFRENMDRFNEEDKKQAEFIIDMITDTMRIYLNFGKITTEKAEYISEPVKKAMSEEEYKEKFRDYLWHKIKKALYYRDYQTALNLLESKELKKDTQDPLAAKRLILAGYLYYYQRDYQKALRYLIESLPLLPRKPAFGDFFGAIFGNINPQKANVATVIGYIYEEKLADYEKANEYYTIAYEDPSDDTGFLNNYAWFLLEKRGDTTKARPLIERALSDKPAEPSFLDTYGYLLLKEGRPQEAINYFKQALEGKGLDSCKKQIITKHLKQVEKAKDMILQQQN
jgi:tetratricopeptide (TPR) repeat protein